MMSGGGGAPPGSGQPSTAPRLGAEAELPRLEGNAEGGEDGYRDTRDTIPDGLEAIAWLEPPLDTIPVPGSEQSAQAAVILPKSPKPPRIHSDMTPTFPMRVPGSERKN